MKYFFIDPLGDPDGDWCTVEKPPKGMGLTVARPSKGRRVGEKYPSDAAIFMSPNYEGIRVGSVVGNTESYLIVAGPVKKVIEAHCKGADIEYLPVALYDHKGRLSGADFFIINPIGAIDCLNLDASEINYLDAPGDAYHGSVVDVDRFVLDPKKVADAPALFRVHEDPYTYVVNGKLADSLRKGGFTNIVLDEIEQQKSES